MNTDDSPLVHWMAQHNIPLTRERYLALDFMGNLPEELDAEYEAMMPSLPSEADIIVGHALGVEVTDALDELDGYSYGFAGRAAGIDGLLSDEDVQTTKDKYR